MHPFSTHLYVRPCAQREAKEYTLCCEVYTQPIHNTILCVTLLFHYFRMSHQLPRELNTSTLQLHCACNYQCKEILLAILGSFLLWLNLYNCIYIANWKHSAEWNCRIVAGLHGTVSATFCFISAFILGPWPFTYIGYPPNSLHCSILVLSFGYFLFDLLWCLYMQTEGLVMLTHHILSILGMMYVLRYDIYGCESSAILGASEFTNPLLQLRWFLKQTNRYSGNTAAFVDWSFVFFFFGARVVVGSALYVCLLLSPRMEVVAKLGGTMMYCVGVIFSIHLGLFIHRKYIKKKPHKDD